MTEVANLNLVHESEAQRQFARIRIPAKIIINQQAYDVIDLSAGGLSIDNAKQALAPKSIYDARLVIRIDQFDFSYAVSLTTLNQMPNNNMGCTFQNVDKQFTTAIRYIITAFLGGELISTGDLINTLSRDNHTSARKNKQLKVATPFERFKSIAGSLSFLAMGITAFSYVTLKIIGIYGVETSTSASVTSYVNEVNMPLDGVISYLISSDTKEVKKGQLLATFSSREVSIDTTHLPQNTKDILDTLDTNMLSSKGSIGSPCDCLIINMDAIDSQFLIKGEKALTLLPKGSEAFITAHFSFKEGEHLKLGQKASYKVYGSDIYQQGIISDIKISEDGLTIQSKIKPDHALPISDFAKPVKVVLTPTFISDSMISWL